MTEWWRVANFDGATYGDEEQSGKRLLMRWKKWPEFGSFYRAGRRERGWSGSPDGD
jgi:hypothetical protein